MVRPEPPERKAVDTHAVYKAVWSVNLQPASVKLVALAYAKFADPDGSNVYPGRASIMELTGYGKDYVRDATNFLIELGVLRIEREATHTQPRRYCIDLEVLHRLASASASAGGELRAEARPKKKSGPGSTRGARVDLGPGQSSRWTGVNLAGGPAPTQPSRHQPGGTKGGPARPPADAGGQARPGTNEWTEL